MKIDTTTWGKFSIGSLFTILNGKGITQEEVEDHPGTLPAVQSGGKDRGILGYIDIDYVKSRDYTTAFEPCLTVARSGTAGCVHFFDSGCVVGDSAKILLLKQKQSREVYLFLQTILNSLRYKYSYGRKVTSAKYAQEIICLPETSDGEPNWQWVEEYIKSLHAEPITTANTVAHATDFHTEDWKPFYLHKLFNAHMGNGIDANKTDSINPRYNYVSRNSTDNGVVGTVDEIDGECLMPAGSLTLSLGGEYLGAAFVQDEPYYTAQNVAVLEPKFDMSLYSKLFISTLIRKESRTLFQAFGRELNTHYKTDFTIRLPVLKDSAGAPVIDKNKEFSDEGYIPDWQGMNNYMESLPYGDRIAERADC